MVDGMSTPAAVLLQKALGVVECLDPLPFGRQVGAEHLFGHQLEVRRAGGIFGQHAKLVTQRMLSVNLSGRGCAVGLTDEAREEE